MNPSSQEHFSEQEPRVHESRSSVRRLPNRKQQRKTDRKLKKAKKCAWYTHQPIPDEVPNRKRKTQDDGSTDEERVRLQQAKRQRLEEKAEQRAQQRVLELKEKKRLQKVKRLQEENEEEDRLIKNLEKRLHLNKRKKKDSVPASFSYDGLDYLLELVNNPKAGLEDEGAGQEESNGDHEESNEELEADDLAEEFDEDDDKDVEEDFHEADGTVVEEPEVALKEDIYGRLRDKDGNVVKSVASGKYIPPGRLATSTTGNESLQRLSKQLKGLLNRLTEVNMAGICSQVEQLFASHSRNDMNEALCSLIFQGCVTASLMPKRLALEHSMFVALLYQNVGAETGSFFIQRLLALYDSLVAERVENENDKRLDNAVLLWCHAFNFKMIHSSMLFGLLQEFVDRFQEKDIDMVLVILREVGFSLRKENPAALKELVLAIQTKSGEKRSDETKPGSRHTFMLETLNAIRNNNMRKIPNYDPSELEHLLKVFRGLIHKGRAMESELNISLTDLRMASERGKWWVVGAAWNKPPLPAMDHSGGQQLEFLRAETSNSAKLLELASQHRMNTDIRKAVFFAVMSAEDYNDAFERIMKLNLKTAQEGEIIHVLLHCCLQERRFNPFYAFVLEKFCKAHRHYQRQLLYALWDKIRDLSTQSATQLRNLAQMVAHGIINSAALPILVLKKINFADMNPTLVRFLRLVLTRLLLTPTEEVTREVFSKLAEKKYRAFRESLRLFVRHFMVRNAKKVLSGDFAECSKELLEKRIDVAERALRGDGNV